MTKRKYTEIIINGLILFAILFFTVAVCGAAGIDDESNDGIDTSAEKIGKENPFKIVEPPKIDEVEIIKSVKGSGITKEELQAAIQAAIKASSNTTPQPVPQIPPVEIIPERHIKSIMLKFLQASNVLPVVTGMLTQYGTASIDKETNTLIVCDSAENLDRIISQIAIVDKTPQQVLVEVVIVDVQLSNDTELGVNWDNLFADADGFLGSVSYVQSLNSLTEGGSLTLIRGRVENTIKALQKERKTEILASPRVLVLSGQKALLETVEEIPYTEAIQSTGGGGGDNAIASTSFKNAGITLTVKPTITDEGKIKVEVEPSQSINTGVAGVGESTVPVVDRRTVNTTLLMQEGEIAVIGGLRSKDIRITQDKIPLLGDMPFIGGFFSNDKEVVENSELIILISPHVYNGSRDLDETEKALWNEVNNLGPIRLGKKIRPEHQLVKKLVPQNKPEKK